MVLKEGERLRCPKCGGKTFLSTAHVTQDWELNEFGTFQKCLNDCIEVTHEPDQDDIWDCSECGFSGAGSEFITSVQAEKGMRLSEERMVECVYGISLMAQHLIEEQRIEMGDSRELLSSVLAWTKEFETAWAKCGIEGDYMEKIKEFAKKKLLDAYGRKSVHKPKELIAVARQLAHEMIADLGHSVSSSGDRWSNYFGIAKAVDGDDQNRVTAALGEEKHDLPESEWGYCLHVINDVDGSDCELYHTDHLSEEELVNLLNDLMKKMEKGEL